MPDEPSSQTNRQEKLPLAQAGQHLLEECRMVLPGIQALFGFQLTVVFHDGFAQKLSWGQQHHHLAAVALLAVAIVLIMTPAAYHRQTTPEEVSDRFIRFAGRLLLASMVPLALSITLDFYLVVCVVHGDGALALASTGLFLVFVFFWFVLPHLRRAH